MSIAFYTAASGMNAFQRKLDVTAHNIANVQTNGYKTRRAAFDNLIRTQINTNVEGNHLVGHGVKQEYIDTLMKQSSLDQTGYALDFAIVGEGFFAVDYRGETMYTRNGAFDLSVDGNLATLITNDGGYVLDRNGNRITMLFEGGTVETEGLT
ncbi:MAG: flagellar hook-basal body complex protein, partial [Saezia sp.]